MSASGKRLIVAAENVAGVEKVHDHLVWVEPMSGMAFPSAEDEAKERRRGLVKRNGRILPVDDDRA